MLRFHLTVSGTGCGDVKPTGAVGFGAGPVARSASPLARVVNWLCQSRKATLPVVISSASGTSEVFKFCSLDFLNAGAGPVKGVPLAEALAAVRISFGSPESGAWGTTSR